MLSIMLSLTKNFTDEVTSTLSCITVKFTASIPLATIVSVDAVRKIGPSNCGSSGLSGSSGSSGFSGSGFLAVMVTSLESWLLRLAKKVYYLASDVENTAVPSSMFPSFKKILLSSVTSLPSHRTLKVAKSSSSAMISFLSTLNVIGLSVLSHEVMQIKIIAKM